MSIILTRNQIALLYTKLILTALFSSFIVVGGRMIASGIPPYSAMFIRFSLAALLMFFILLKRNNLKKITQITHKQWGAFIALSLSGVVAFNWFMLTGLKTVPAARAGIIYGLYPLCTWVAAWLFLKEGFSRSAVLGSLVCLAGVLLALSQGSSTFIQHLAPNLGDGLLFISLACWVCYALITAKLIKILDPLFVTAVTCILSAILLLPAALLEGLPGFINYLSRSDWGILVFQSVFSTTLAFLWYCEGMKKLGAGKATLFLNIMPLGTVFMAAVLLAEPLFLAQVVGAVLVCAGVWLAGRKKRAEA